MQEGNSAADEPLVLAAVGGVHGGGALLTPRGKLSLEVFDQLRGNARESAARLLQATLSPRDDEVDTIHLAAAISLQEALGQLLTEYALRQPGLRVRAVYGASNELADHVLAGAVRPVRLRRSAAPRSAGDRGAHSRQVPLDGGDEQSGRDRSRQGFSLRHAPRFAAPRHLVLADPASPLGKCSRAYLEQIDLYDALLPRAVHVDNSRAVLAAIRSGRADAGLAFASDVAKATDCRLLFSIDPAEASLTYFAAVCSGRREKDAQALLDFFQTPAAQRSFRRCGLTLPRRNHNSK